MKDNKANGLTIGVDVGATTTRIGLVDSTGQVISSVRFETPKPSKAQIFWTALLERIEKFTKECDSPLENIYSLGITLPATLSQDRRCIAGCVNLPFLEGSEVPSQLLEFDHRATVQRTTEPQTKLNPDLSGVCTIIRKLKLFTLCTDAEAATWGEYAAYTPTPSRFVHLRLGTGIALGMVNDGTLQRLDANRTTHSPLLVVDRSPQAKLCPCGLSGCLERYASGPAIKKSMRRFNLKPDLTELEKKHTAGDKQATEIIQTAASHIASAIHNFIKEWHPDIIVLGGGVIENLPSLTRQVSDNLRNEKPTVSTHLPQIVSSKRGDLAGVVGAALLGNSINHSHP